MSRRILYETHSHTPLCKHAVGEPIEYAAVAEERGLKGLLVTCHNPMPPGFSTDVRMDVDEFIDYLHLVDCARRHWAGCIDVRLGLEADYFPGYEMWLGRQLRTPLFQYVLGSVHPQITEFRERFWHGDPIAFQVKYFELLAETAECGLFDCLAHPDLVKNETPTDWDPTRIMSHIEQSLDRIAETGVAMELNTSGLNKAIPEMNPFPGMLIEMHKRGIPVTIGSDAHRPERVGDRFEEALYLLSACGYSHVSYFLERTRIDVPIEEAKLSLTATNGKDSAERLLDAAQPVRAEA